jgi:hypothetical protein
MRPHVFDRSLTLRQVRHLRATVAGPLLPTICSLLGLLSPIPQKCSVLPAIGESVARCNRCGTTAGSITSRLSEQVLIVRQPQPWSTSAQSTSTRCFSISQWARSHVTQMREGVLQVRAESGALEQVIPKDTYLRVHSHPRRFPIATTTDWASRVVASSPHFVVLDKPGGVPIHRTLDNATETAEVCTARALNTRLWALHRLDVSALARPPHSTFALDPIRTPCRPPRRLSPPGLAPARRATKL